MLRSFANYYASVADSSAVLQMGLLNDFNKTVSTVSRTATNVKRVIRTVDGVGDAL